MTIRYTDGPKVLFVPGQAKVAVSTFAEAPCGCAVYVGARLDNQEAATVVAPCREAHMSIALDFNERMLNSLPEATAEPLIDVADRFLTAAYEAHMAATA